MNLLEWDEIARGLTIGLTMVTPAYLLSWYLAHIVCSIHEKSQRELIDKLKQIIDETT